MWFVHVPTSSSFRARSISTVHALCVSNSIAWNISVYFASDIWYMNRGLGLSSAFDDEMHIFKLDRVSEPKWNIHPFIYQVNNTFSLISFAFHWRYILFLFHAVFVFKHARASARIHTQFIDMPYDLTDSWSRWVQNRFPLMINRSAWLRHSAAFRGMCSQRIHLRKQIQSNCSATVERKPIWCERKTNTRVNKILHGEISNLTQRETSSGIRRERAKERASEMSRKGLEKMKCNWLLYDCTPLGRAIRVEKNIISNMNDLIFVVEIMSLWKTEPVKL